MKTDANVLAKLKYPIGMKVCGYQTEVPGEIQYRCLNRRIYQFSVFSNNFSPNMVNHPKKKVKHD